MSRHNPYRAIFGVPGAAAFSAAGGLARLPLSMLGISVVLMVQTLTGSYEVAGRVAAVATIATAIGTPLVAQVVDRRGQRAVLPPMLAITSAGLAGLIAFASAGAPEWTLWLCAVVAGVSQGSYGSYVRARWSSALRDPQQIHTALAFEAVVDEIVFIVGPVLATMLATLVLPSAGVIIAGSAGLVGGILFVLQRRTEPPVSGRDSAATPVNGRDSATRPVSGRDSATPPVGGRDSATPPSGRDSATPPSGRDSATPPARGRDSTTPASGRDSTTPPVSGREAVVGTDTGRRSAILVPGMPALALVFVATGVIFGAVDVSTVAYATEQGGRAGAGLLLAAFSSGSLISGLGYGALHWRSRLSTRFVVGSFALAVGVSLFQAAPSRVWLAVVMFVAGFAVSPTIVTGNGIIQAIMPPHRLTEGLAWVGTAIGAGAALGSWAAGIRIDAAGSGGGFRLVLVAGWVTVLVALAGLRSIRRA